MQMTILTGRSGLIALAALVLLSGAVAAWAQKATSPFQVSPPVEKGVKIPQEKRLVSASESDVLKGLQGLTILIEGLNDDAKNIGLTIEQIKSTTELSLRRNGVPIRNKAGTGMAYLYININYLGSGAYSVNIQLKENTYLERDPNTLVIGSTIWEAGSLGTSRNADYILKSIERYVDSFCLDYLKANPK